MKKIIKNTEKKPFSGRIILISILALLLAAIIIGSVWYFLIPRPILPESYTKIVCNIMTVDGEQIWPSDEELDELAAIIGKYRMTGTLKRSQDIGLSELRIVLTFWGEPGEYTTMAGVSFFSESDDSLNCVAQKQTWPRNMLYVIKDGEELKEELMKKIMDWGYI